MRFDYFCHFLTIFRSFAVPNLKLQYVVFQRLKLKMTIKDYFNLWGSLVGF